MKDFERADQDSPIGTLSRGLHLLEHVAAIGGDVRLRELAARSGLDKATTHRLASKLVDRGYLRRDADGRLAMGLRIVNLAFTYLASLDIRTHALPEMRELLADFDFSVSLCVPDGAEIVYLERLQAKRPLPMFSLGVGARKPAYCTAGGKAILAFLAPSELETTLAKTTFQPLTERTLSSRNALLADLKRTAKRGFALAEQERMIGYHEAGAPLFDDSGSCIGCISMGGLDSYASAADFRNVIGPRLVKSAQRISAQLVKRRLDSSQ